MINKEMTIQQILMTDTGVADILMDAGMHCLGCPHATSESLSDACAAHGADVDALVEKLNAHMAEQG